MESDVVPDGPHGTRDFACLACARFAFIDVFFFLRLVAKKPNSARKCKLDAFSCASEPQYSCKQLFSGFMVTEKSAEITWYWCDARKNMFNLGIYLGVENRCGYGRFGFSSGR